MQYCFLPGQTVRQHDSCRAYRSFGALPWGETVRNFGFHYQVSIGDILTSGNGQVLAVFGISQGDSVADVYGTWDDRWNRICVALAKESDNVRQPIHISTRENTRTQLQAPWRKRRVAVVLGAAEGLVDRSPRCWIGHTPRFLNEPHHGLHCSVPLSLRAGSEPQEKMGSF